jgi:hypothetical protein
MGLINPKPRFAFDPDTDQVYDYLKQRDVPLTEDYSALDGVWDLLEVKRLILAGLPVEGARRYGPPPAEPLPGMPAGDPAVPGPQPTTNAPATGGAGTTGLSVEQLTALKLSALQAAALGLTPTQLTATGVTALQVDGWGMDAARAEALKLTAEQRAVLLP